jgi:hypothetical protein
MPRTPPLDIDWARHAPDLTTATTVRLHPRAGESAPTASKMGGPIAWPRAETWPRCEEHDAPLVPVLQLARADVSELPWPTDADLFQLLWCPRDHEDHGYAPRSSAWWRRAGDGPWADGPPPGDDANEDYVPKPCVLAPERVIERPSAFELGGTRVGAIETAVRAAHASALAALGIPEETALYQYHLSVAPGTKALGHVRWIQDPDVPRCACGAAMQHLVTIDSAEFDGAWHRWMSLDERHVWTGDYKQRKAIQMAAGLMLGDMGAIFVFTCTTCPSRPIATRHQCS